MFRLANRSVDGSLDSRGNDVRDLRIDLDSQGIASNGTYSGKTLPAKKHHRINKITVSFAARFSTMTPGASSPVTPYCPSYCE